MKNFDLHERLAIACDFESLPGENAAAAKVRLFQFLEKIRDFRGHIKVESLLRQCGYPFIQEIQKAGFLVFADLKLYGTNKTLKLDGQFLSLYEPDMLSVACSVGVESLRLLKGLLPHTEVVGITFPTNLDEQDARAFHLRSIAETVDFFTKLADFAGIDGIVCGGKEIPIVPVNLHTLSVNVVNVRPDWAKVRGDDQNSLRSVTPREAILGFADRVIVGRPITDAKNPMDAIKRILDEINLAYADSYLG